MERRLTPLPCQSICRTAYLKVSHSRLLSNPLPNLIQFLPFHLLHVSFTTDKAQFNTSTPAINLQTFPLTFLLCLTVHKSVSLLQDNSPFSLLARWETFAYKLKTSNFLITCLM